MVCPPAPRPSRRQEARASACRQALTQSSRAGLFLTSTTDGLLALYDVHTANEAAIALR
jgi:hypothetical protein